MQFSWCVPECDSCRAVSRPCGYSRMHSLRCGQTSPLIPTPIRSRFAVQSTILPSSFLVQVGQQVFVRFEFLAGGENRVDFLRASGLLRRGQ